MKGEREVDQMVLQNGSVLDADRKPLEGFWGGEGGDDNDWVLATPCAPNKMPHSCGRGCTEPSPS